MKYSSIVNSIRAQFELTNRVIFYIEGAPGGGKSAAAKEVGRLLGYDKVITFFASLRDPVDLLGTPRNDGAVTQWIPPKELFQLTTGRNLLILEELSDAPIPMQNALCGLMYDRVLNDLVLSPTTDIIATGNRAKDKSGATRIVSKLAGRVRRITFSEDLEDWVTWAKANNIDPVLIQFLRFCPNLLSAFDPNADSSPTPRNWEFVSMCPTNLPAVDFLENIAGHVGEGAAAQYVGFRRTWESLPDLATALLHPMSCPVPTKADVQYATLGALAARVDKANFENALKYADRFSADMSIMFIQDVTGRIPSLKSTTQFINYAVAHQDVIF
jgi:hypothetical protein